MLPPRLAVGTWGSPNRFTDLWPAVDASLSALDIRPQWFHCQARHQNSLVPGNSRRSCYLDAWSMSAPRCAELLTLGAIGSCLAVVAGQFDSPADHGGNLLELSRVVDLPRVLVIDAEEALTAELSADLQLLGVVLAVPNLPNTTTLVERAARHLEQMLGVPVVGYFANGKVTWTEAFQVKLIAACDSNDICCRRESFMRCRERRRWPLRVAIAYDEAFSGYFPETLSTLQACGATLLDFSPLKNDCLPKDADVVYLGDGLQGEWLARIAANHCFLHRLCAFANRGGKIVAEGRAAVCLCREARPLSGGSIPLAGILPAIADETTAAEFIPLSLQLAENSWLAKPGTLFQGYAPQQWRITTDEADGSLVQPGKILVRGNTLVLPFAQHWASRPDLIRSFFRARGRRQPDNAAV